MLSSNRSSDGIPPPIRVPLRPRTPHFSSSFRYKISLKSRPLIIISNILDLNLHQFGYWRFCKPENYCADYYARWWFAPFLTAAVSFSQHWDRQTFAMRLDAPELLANSHDGYIVIKMPFWSAVERFIKTHTGELILEKELT